MDKLQEAVRKLELKDYPGFDKVLKEFLKDLNKADKKVYVKDIFQRAKINKASRLHEHGISLGRTAELLDISQFELMDYIGKTYIADVKEILTISEKDRLKTARSLFL